MRISSVSVILFLLIVNPVEAVNYYVSPTGNDSNDGKTKLTAWVSIDNGDSMLLPGDTVYVLSGTYTDSVVITDSGLADDNIVYAGVQDSTLIDGTGFSVAVEINSDHITWSGIRVVSASKSNIHISGEYNTVKECRISYSEKYGVNIASGNHNVVLKNVFDDNSLVGVLVSDDSTSIINNTFYNSGNMAIDGLSSDFNSITNCIFQGVGNANVAVRAGTATELTYSDIYGHNTPVQGGVALGAGCLEVDPLLANPDSGNYRLSSESPVIDAGIDVALPFNGFAPDMGAYETTNLASLSITPNYDSLFANSAYQFEVIALDNDSNPASPGELTWSHTFPTGVIDSTGLFIPQLAGSGTIVVTSSIGDISDTTDTMNIVPGSLDSLSITPTRDTISADSTRQFSAVGFDVKGNAVSNYGNLTWEVLNNIGAIDATGLFAAGHAGDGFIRVSSDLGPSAVSDTITVLPGEIGYIETVPTANAIEEASSYQYHAYGYDADSNFVKDLTDSVTWSTTDPTGSITSNGLYTAGNILSPPVYFAKAVYNGTLSDSSEITVITSGVLDYIRIEWSDATPFGDTTLTTDDDTTMLYCRAYDSGDNLLGNTSVSWSVISVDSIGIVVIGPESFTVLTLSGLGTGKVVAEHTSGAKDTTGVITCGAGTAASLIILPDTVTVSADSTILFSSISLDADSNQSNPVIAPSWTVLGGIGTIDSTGLFTPSSSGVGYIVGSGGGLADTTGPITVTPGVLDRIVITPNNAVIGVHDMLQFVAEGLDSKSNPTDAGDLTWKILGRIGIIDTGGLYVANLPGVCSVMVSSSIDGINDTSGALNVEALYVTGIALGDNVVSPGQDLSEVLAFRIENFYDENKAVTSITVHDVSRGAGSIAERLENVDSIALYCDIDNDSGLTQSDSLITSVSADNELMTLSFSPVIIQPRSGCTFIVSADINLYPHDGDSLDHFLFPSTDILTSDGSVIDGPDTLNSLGYNIIDGLIAAQLIQSTTGITLISPNDTMYHVVAIDIPRNGYSEDTLRIFSVVNYGTASNDDLDSLILFMDDGNNAWDGPEVEMALGELIYTGGQWIRSGLCVPLTDPTNRFYVGARLSSYPVNEATLALTIPVNGLEMFSQNDGPIDSSLQPVDTIEIQTSEAVSVAVVGVPSLDLVPGEYTDPLAGLELINGYSLPIDIDSIRISLYATDPDSASQEQLDSQIDSILIYLNRDGDYAVRSPIDSLLASAPLDGGSAMLKTGGLAIAASGGIQGLCVVALMNLENSKNGNLINVGLSGTSAVYAGSATITGDFPLKNPSDHIIRAFPASSITINAVDGVTLYGGQTNQPVFDFGLPRDGYSQGVLRSLKLKNIGTLNEPEALESVYLWGDKSNNGFSPDDTLLGSFTYDGINWTITGLVFPLTGSTNRFIVTVDIASDQFEGGTLQFAIPVEGALYWSGTTGPDDADTGNPSAHLAFPPNRVTAISIPAPSRPVSPGSSANIILSYALYNGYVEQVQTLQAITLTNISHSLSSLSYADYELGQVYLYLDSDSNRTFYGDSLVATGYFADGKLQLTGLGIQLAPGTLSYFFVLVDIPQSVIDSDSLAVAISAPSDLAFSGAVNINGDLPLTNAGFLIIDGSVRSQYTVIDLLPRTLLPGDTSITFFAFRPAANGNQPDTLRSITVANLGDADTSDIASLELWLDLNVDGVWQWTDSLIELLSYGAGTWSTNSMALEIGGSFPTLFLIGDVSTSATPNAIFQAEIPLGGCQYASGNDGPLDSALSTSNAFIISNSGLRVDCLPLPETFSIGQSVDVKITVTNLLDATTMDSVTGQIVNVDNPAIISLDSNTSGPTALGPGESTEFAFYYSTITSGTVMWQFRSVAPTVADSSAVVQTNPIRIQAPPADVAVDLIGSTPTSVIRGQANVFPFGISFSHPDTSLNMAALRLDTLMLTVKDGSGSDLQGNEVFSRMVLATGYTNLAIWENVPALTSIPFIFSEPVIVSPGEEQIFSLLVDVDSAATASNFVLAIEDAGGIPITDRNTLQAVSIDASVGFPLETAPCRIDAPSRQMVVSYTSVHDGAANYGQNDVEIVQLNLRHPGATGSSQIQLTRVSLMIVDDTRTAINALDLLDDVKLRRQQNTVGRLTDFNLDTTELEIQLSAPLTLNPGETDSLRILVSLKDESIHSGFSLLIPDSSAFLVRDLSSGWFLEVGTDTLLAAGSIFPIASDWVTLKDSAIPPHVCITPILPSSVIGGTDSLGLIEFSFVYPAASGHSSVLLQGALVAVLDTLDKPLDADRLFDRVGVSVSDDSVIYQSYIKLRNGLTLFDFGNEGILLNQGDSVKVRLVGDVESDVPYDHFILRIQEGNAISLSDVSDTSHHPGISPATGCTAAFPYSTDMTRILLPAGQPRLAFQSLPVQIAYQGQTGVSVYDCSWTYDNATPQGDLALHGLRGNVLKRTADGLIPVTGSEVFSAVHLWLDNQLVASDTSLVNDSLLLTLEDVYTISKGASITMSMTCDIRQDALLGNYVIGFNDSTFLDITDKELSTIIHPAIGGQSYPVYSAEISLATASLENSFTNYPNPFNPSRGEVTTIGFVLAEDAYVDIELFSITGEAVKQVTMNSFRAAGTSQRDAWSGINDVGCEIVPGTYYCRITARYGSGMTKSLTRKIAVIR